MPIFAQAGITARALSTGFGRLRVRDDDDETRLSARTARRNARADDVSEDEEARAAGSRTDLRALLQRSQFGELIRERLREARSGGQTDTPSTATPDADAEEATPAPVVPQRALPGVGTVRTEADDDVERPGRLNPATANPILSRAQSPVGRVNVAQAPRAEIAVPVATPSFPDTARPVTPPFDAGRDAQIRLLAASTREEAPATPATDTPAAPTAEQISRANTTEEIRQNLQAGARVVGTELQSAAIRQQQTTTQRIAQETEQVAQEQQAETVDENRSELRDLRTEQRQLERDLSETEREIRSREGQNARLQSGVQGSPAAAAVALGSQLNILSV